MDIDKMKLYDAMVKKVYEDGITFTTAAEQIGTSRLVFKNLREESNLMSYTLVRIMNWLGITDLKPFLTE